MKKITLSEIATKKVLAVTVGTTADQVVDAMKNKRIRHMPVMTFENEIVGVVSQRDLSNVSNPERYPIELFMASPVESIEESASLREAILKMLEKKISCLVVTNTDDHVVGIVTTDDILWQIAQILKEEDESNKPLVKVMNMKFIGDLANRLSDIGI